MNKQEFKQADHLFRAIKREFFINNKPGLVNWMNFDPRGPQSMDVLVERTKGFSWASPRGRNLWTRVGFTLGRVPK